MSKAELLPVCFGAWHVDRNRRPRCEAWQWMRCLLREKWGTTSQPRYLQHWLGVICWHVQYVERGDSAPFFTWQATTPAQVSGSPTALHVCMKCFTCLSNDAPSHIAAAHAAGKGHHLALRLGDWAIVDLVDGSLSGTDDSAATAVARQLRTLAMGASSHEQVSTATAADSDAALAALLAAEDGFAVMPLQEYEGAHKHVSPAPADLDLTQQPSCSECGASECWVCLQCWGVRCSRYAAGHAAAHAEATGHDIALSLGDMSLWSFSKDSYLDVFNIPALHDAFRAAYVSKFGTEPDLPVITLSVG